MTQPLNDYDAAILRTASQPAQSNQPKANAPVIDAYDLGCLAARGIKLDEVEIKKFAPPQLEPKPVHFCAISERVNENSKHVVEDVRVLWTRVEAIDYLTKKHNLSEPAQTALQTTNFPIVISQIPQYVGNHKLRGQATVRIMVCGCDSSAHTISE